MAAAVQSREQALESALEGKRAQGYRIESHDDTQAVLLMRSRRRFFNSAEGTTSGTCCRSTSTAARPAGGSSWRGSLVRPAAPPARAGQTPASATRRTFMARAADASITLLRDGRPDDRRHRGPRRAGDPALRAPAARAGRGARPRPAGRARGAPPRRGADGTARAARVRLVEGGRGRAGVARRAPAGNGCRAPRPWTSRSRAGRERAGVRPRDGRDARDRPRDREAVRPRRRERVALGYLRNDAAAEEACPRAARRSAPSRRSSAATSPRSGCSREIEALGPLDAVVHNAATGVIRPALETEDKHWDWTLNANARALLSLARVDGAVDAAGLVDRGDLEPRLVPRARELRPHRHLEGGARVGRPVPRRSSSRRAGSASTPSPAGSSRRARSTTSRTARRCSAPAANGRPRAGMVEPDDIAGAVAFLCSPDAAMVRGQTLIVDGGFSLPA